MSWRSAITGVEMRRATFVFLCSLGVLALAACGGSTSKTVVAGGAGGAGACTQGPAISQTVLTPSYKMVLDVGPQEAMYTPAQFQAQHPTHGEVMLRGQMSNTGGMGQMGNMGASASARHLEVHICDRATGRVETNLAPAITLVDNSAANMTNHVPTAVMEGTTAGQADLHYGNNVVMPPSRRFTVTVAVADQHATFHLQTPAGS